MIGRVKKWLGIEGVKLSLHTEEPLVFGDPYLRGHVVFQSMREGRVRSVYLNLKELYTRGRGKGRRTDEFLMGESTLEGPIDIPVDEEVSIPFELKLGWYTSEMDDIERRGVFSKQFARVAKWMKGVQSRFVLTAEARVEGTKLHPFAQEELRVKS